MLSKLENILEKSKICYKKCVLMENEVLEESLLSIMSDAKYLIENINSVKIKKGKNFMNENLIKEDEINKIYRKVPQWLKKSDQINHVILVTFMKLSNSNQFPITISTLEKNCNFDSKIFNSNFNQMKIISKKNNGKVFEEMNGEVSLWKPISDFVIYEYEKVFNNEKNCEKI